MRHHKHLRRFLRRAARGLAALLCVAALTVPDGAAPTAGAVTMAEINELKDDANALTAQRKNLKSQLEQLKKDKSQALNRKELLDQEIANLTSQIENTQAQIDAYAELIVQTEAELEDAERREAEQYELFCKRVRAMEERGEVSYWAVLFRAESFSDLLSRLDDVNAIMEADQEVIDKLQVLQEETKAKKAELEEQMSGEEAAKVELEAKRAELDAQREEANQVIRELTENANETEAAIDGLEEEEAAIEREIKRLNQEWAAQQAALGQSAQSNPGGYIWPVDSRYITSTMGGRTSPGGIGSTNHQGTDIGRVGYTSPIYAAKAGTVIVSQRSNSYGEYVVISHGSGNTTLYGHMSSRKVSVGQYVNQGDVIGITGSTGNSTGPHLHFEVVENGSRVNPLDKNGIEPRKGYLTGYTLSGRA